MATISTIEWTEMTWNPVTGCTKISQGCKHCYAERLAERFWAGRAFTDVQLHPDRLDIPRRWRRGRVVFVNSMSDLFHEEVSDQFIAAVFEVMAECPQHTFQVLTKRADRLARLAPHLPWPNNVWVGVSVEDARVVSRIDRLRNVPAAVRFLSLEPLIGPLERLALGGIDWVIVGGESGPGARQMNPEWVESIFKQCRRGGVPFFFKQWGGVHKARTGRKLHGRTYDEYPLRRQVLAV
jgi:protein gp37